MRAFSKFRTLLLALDVVLTVANVTSPNFNHGRWDVEATEDHRSMGDIRINPTIA